MEAEIFNRIVRSIKKNAMNENQITELKAILDEEEKKLAAKKQADYKSAVISVTEQYLLTKLIGRSNKTFTLPSLVRDANGSFPKVLDPFVNLYGGSQRIAGTELGKLLKSVLKKNDFNFIQTKIPSNNGRGELICQYTLRG